MFNAYLHYLIPPAPYISLGSPAWSRLATPRSASAHICKPAYKPPNKKPRREQRARNTRRGKTGAPVSTGPLGDHLQRGRGERWRVCPSSIAWNEFSPRRGGTTGTPHRGVFRSVPVPVRFVHRNEFHFVPFRSFCSTSVTPHEQLRHHARLHDNEAVLSLLEHISVNK